MALQKEITYKEVVCNYHKIVRIDSEFHNYQPDTDEYTKMDVTVALYKDNIARNNSVENYLRLKQYHFLKSEPKSPSNEKIDKVYIALKKLDEFDGSIDI
jgi:hypothetical protein